MAIMKIMLTLFILFILTIRGGIANSIPVPVPMPLPATETTQWLNNMELITANATLVDSLQQQIEQVKHHLTQIEHMKKNLMNIPKQEWSSVEADIQKAMSMLSKGEMISISSGDVSRKFEEKYPGYKPDKNYMSAYKDWLKSSRDALKSTLASVGIQSEQFSEEEKTIKKLRDMSETAEGRMQALQVGTQISVEIAAQLQKLRQLTMSQIQSETNYRAAKQAKESTVDANIEEAFKYKPLPKVEYKYF